VLISAGFYVLSGTIQPLVMTLLKEAGLANPDCQLYMLFYYLTPALFILPFAFLEKDATWPILTTVLKSSLIACFDIFSQVLNYTGASMAGPTIFAIVYSSVTIWTAVFSQIILGRKMNACQWTNVILVFVGLTITATDSAHGGSDVAKGSCFILLGSAMHGITYVCNESIMTVGQQQLSVLQNNFVQSGTNGCLLLAWQLFYTLPHFNEDIRIPMNDAKTSIAYASILLGVFGLLSIIHSYTYFFTLKHYPDGATSAGVMKGLQAVMVFVFTDRFYCNKLGGPEMCFSRAKFVSLVTVCGGVLGYGYTTPTSRTSFGKNTDNHETTKLLSVSP